MLCVFIIHPFKTCVRVLIDTRHRLRPERIISGKASLLEDIKEALVSTWQGLVHIFCCCLVKVKERNVSDRSDYDDDYNDQQNDQHKPLLNS